MTGLRSIEDAELRGLLRGLLKELGRTPARRRELGHLAKAAAWVLRRRPGSMRFGQVDESKESAHYDAVRQEIVLDEGLRRQPFEVAAAVLVHELQHAYDDMTGTPYTFEAELRSFRAESAWLSWTPPAEVAAKVRDANTWHWFGYIYRKRLEVLRGELESSALLDFVKSYLGEAKFEGLQGVEKVVLDTRKALELKERELEAVRRELARKPLEARERRASEARREILEADLGAGRRVLRRLLKEQARVRRGNPLSLA